MLGNSDLEPCHNNCTNDSVLYHIFGLDCFKSMSFIRLKEPNKILYIAGKALIKLDLVSKKRTYLYNNKIHDIGCIATSTKLNQLFIGINKSPSIIVCSLEDFTVQTELICGSSTGFVCLDVSTDGRRLCSVGTGPISLITIWDLENKSPILSAKIYRQEVMRAIFSPYSNDQITSYGKGHVKFWNITNTFTGLKLQGDVGKFGRIDPGNITSTIHLPNGTILSGSEKGYLLLWEDSILICTFSMQDATDNSKAPPIHLGGVRHITFDRKKNNIISVGADGCIRWFPYSIIETVQIGSGDQMNVPISSILMKQIKKGLDLCHCSLSPKDGDDEILLLASNGEIWKVEEETNKTEKIYNFQACSISGMDVSPLEHIAVTVSSGGDIRCYDFLGKKEIASTNAAVPCTAVIWAPQSMDQTMRTFLVGFGNGTVRCFYLKTNSIIPRYSMRPHSKNDAVKILSFNINGSLFTSCSENGDIFVFSTPINIEKNSIDFEPIGFIPCINGINSIVWQSDIMSFRYLNLNGIEFLVDISEIRAKSFNASTERSYLLPVKQQQVKVSDIAQQPLGLHMRYQQELRIHSNDCILTALRESFDQNFFITSGSDGLLCVYRINQNSGSKMLSKNNCTVDDTLVTVLRIGPSDVKSFMIINDKGEGCSIQPNGYSSISTILNTSVLEKEISATSNNATNNELSIEQEMEKDRVDTLDAAVKEKKKASRNRIDRLRAEYNEILDLNLALPKDIRLCSELVVDSTLDRRYEELKHERICEVNNKNKMESEKWFKLRKKLEDTFINNLDFGHIVVNALRNNNEKVQSMPTLKLPSSFTNIREQLIASFSMTTCRKNTNYRMRNEQNTIMSNDNKMEITGNFVVDERVKDKTQSSFDCRKSMRDQRKKMIQKILSEKPDEKEDDPHALQKIEDAKLFGDFPLKSSKGYNVPQWKQLDLIRKLQEMVSLQESINDMKKSFNSDLVMLRDRKVILLEDIRNKNNRMREIDIILNEPESSLKLWEPSYTFDGLFENHYQFTDMNRKVANEALRSCSSNIGEIKLTPPSTTFCAYDVQAQSMVENEFCVSADLQKKCCPILNICPMNILPSLMNLNSSSAAINCEKKKLSLVEVDEQRETKALLTNERLTTQVEIKFSVTEFDQTLNEIRKQRFQISPKIKEYELKLSFLLKELECLLELGGNEHLLSKLTVCEEKIAKLTESINMYKSHLNTKKLDLNIWFKQDQAVSDEFDSIVPVSHLQREYLLRIFSKKVKRSVCEDLHNYESDSDFGDDDDSSDDDVDDVCPENCTIDILNHTLQLRTKRLDSEKEFIVLKKETEKLKQRNDHFCALEKEAKKELDGVKNEIQLFENDKQASLNKLPAFIPLKSDQIYLWNEQNSRNDIKGDKYKSIKTDAKMPTCVIFSKSEFTKLRQRINQLEDYILNDVKQLKDIKKDSNLLDKEKVIMEQDILDLRKRSEELQMLKFGMHVDLDVLDQRTTRNEAGGESNIVVEVSLAATAHEKDIQKHEIAHLSQKNLLLGLTKTNTTLLQEIASLQHQETNLIKQQNLIYNKSNANNQKENETETNDLISLVKGQEKEISVLKEKIKILKRKDGNVYGLMARKHENHQSSS